jgi:molybdopterin molybdotransferase
MGGAAQKPEAGLLPVDLVRAGLLALADPVRGEETVPLRAAAGRVLARPAIAASAFPAFDHAAMDGWALSLPASGTTFRIVGRVAAGAGAPRRLAPGEALRIFTGAPIPEGADAVLRQEDAEAAGDVVLPSVLPQPGQHVRRAGEDVARDSALLTAGTLLDARHLALLAAVGSAEVTVRRRVRIAVLSTGTELVEAGSERSGSGIYDANRPMLLALLQSPWADVADHGIVPDDPTSLAACLSAAASGVDLVVTTGGTSVGEEDHLVAAVRAAGGNAVVTRMAVKPGKPAVFGTFGSTLLCGLPGNPFAALVSAVLFSRPVAESLAGRPALPLAPIPARSGFSHHHAPGRLEFIPASVQGYLDGGAPVLARLGGGAARLRPLVESDGLAVISPFHGDVASGGEIGFLPFVGGLFS